MGACPFLALGSLLRQLDRLSYHEPTVHPYQEPPVEPLSPPSEETLRLDGRSPLLRYNLLRQLQKALSRVQPVLVVIDDAQWCDRESLEVLTALLFDEGTQRLMLLLTGYLREDEAGRLEWTWEPIRQALLGSLRSFQRTVLEQRLTTAQQRHMHRAHN